jgi:hypothetical protein
MARAHPLRQWTVLVAVFALLLKAAVPMLASAAAHAQGKAVADICSVYGVRSVVASSGYEHAAQDHHAGHEGHDGPSPDHGSSSGSAHAGDHCALTALAALAPPDEPQAAMFERIHRAAHRAVAAGAVFAPDAAALWAAELQHGPPRFS